MPEDDEDDEETLPHSEAVDVFQEGLAMVVQDPLLCDLPIQVTLEEVNSQIALEYGQAMTVRVCKMDGEVMRKYQCLSHFLLLERDTVIKGTYKRKCCPHSLWSQRAAVLTVTAEGMAAGRQQAGKRGPGAVTQEFTS